MPFKLLTLKRTDECQVHGTPSRAANRTLLVMLLLALALIIWQVWVGSGMRPEAEKQPFLLLLGRELWNLVFDRHGILAELWDVFPYFMVGILLAGYIRTYKLAVRLQAKLRRYGFLSIFLAAIVGLITPLCACGTLTTAISLLFAGLPLAPVMALLVTSPLMSPSTYLLTLNDLGPEWTVIRTLAAFLLGITAGVVTHLLQNRGFRTQEIFIEGAIPRGDFHDEAYPDERLRCNCREAFGHRVAARTGNMFVVYLAKSSEMLWLVGKYVLVGVAIGAVVERYLPPDWLSVLFGRKDPLSVLWITLGSVPVFLHQISASSILYHIKSSVHGTLDGAAALALLIGGPVTAMPTMILFWTVFRKRVFALYMLVCILGTIGIAYTFRYAVFVPGVDTGNPLVRGVASLSGGSAAVIAKQGRNVRIVMDPGGKAMIAIYTNDVEGHGGIVFDAGSARLLGASADRIGNRKYVRNTAQWLEQYNASAVHDKILIYDTLTGPGTDAGNQAINANALAALESRGFRVTVLDRRETPTVTGSLLKEYSQFWIVFRADAGRSLSDAELDTVERFSGEGKGMLIVVAQRSSVGNLDAVNRLSSRYGAIFSGAVEHPELRVTRATDLLTGASRMLEKIL